MWIRILSAALAPVMHDDDTQHGLMLIRTGRPT